MYRVRPVSLGYCFARLAHTFSYEPLTVCENLIHVLPSKRILTVIAYAVVVVK